MSHPIPKAALDDRLGFVGTSGSGKTYCAGGAVERLLSSGARVVTIDPLGVWWGLRLSADGKVTSGYDVAIFGGPHGDLPLNEHAGALIGETAATMAESCIIDLSQLATKSAERRFMTGFLDAIYRKATGNPFHLVVDEADLFAPQKPPKGDETLLNLMEQIVRRGRIKGFIPWLITQRPAVINKNVLSQVDGLVAFKLTSSQDRDALDAWIEGQADKAEGKAIKDNLPALPIGTGVVWMPKHGILETRSFPVKHTFDSSRTPKRGEKVAKTKVLKPLDLGELKDRLKSVEAETKANDPKALRAEVAKLQSEKKTLERQINEKSKSAPDPKGIETAEMRGYERAKRELAKAAEKEIRERALAMLGRVRAANDVVVETCNSIAKEMKLRPDLKGALTFTPAPPVGSPARVPSRAPIRPAPPARRPITEASGDGTFARPQMKILQSLAMWWSLGHATPSREMVAAVAGYSPSSGGFNNLLGALKGVGAIDYPQPGKVKLLVDDVAVMSKEDGRVLMVSTLSNPQRRIIAALIDQGTRTRDELGADTDYSPSSGGFNNILGQLRTLGLIDYPQAGSVAMSDWAQELLAGYAERIAA